jgi:hypothetical protein
LKTRINGEGFVGGDDGSDLTNVQCRLFRIVTMNPLALYNEYILTKMGKKKISKVGAGAGGRKGM